MIDEPLGAFLYRSSIIFDLSDSGLFHGQLLTVLGSPSNFHGCRTPRCAYVSAIKTRSLAQFWPVSWTITQFWGPEVICTIDDSQGAFTCRSSTLAVFVDSDLFRGLLFAVLASQSNVHGCRTPRCAYVLVVKTHSLGRFWPISWTTTQLWGPEMISTIDQPRVSLRVGHQQSQFWLILVCFMHYYSAFWGLERFPRLTVPRVRLRVNRQHS